MPKSEGWGIIFSYPEDREPYPKAIRLLFLLFIGFSGNEYSNIE